MKFDLFPETKISRKKPRVMMHVVDVGDCIAKFKCKKCGTESQWIPVTNATEGKRGVPCPECNQSSK